MTRTVRIYLIRHGRTRGNEERRYIGRTDESLSVAGREEIRSRKYPPVNFVFTSPMKRCVETAEIIYPKVPREVIPEFQETDFGIFEGKNYEELKDNVDYIRWLESGGTRAFPEGESREEVRERVQEGFQRVRKRIRTRGASGAERSVALVVHGGTVMELVSELFGGNYYDYQVRNGEGYSFELSYGGLCSGLRAGFDLRGSGALVPSGTVDGESDSEADGNFSGESQSGNRGGEAEA